jgi:hypothetical protein
MGEDARRRILNAAREHGLLEKRVMMPADEPESFALDAKRVIAYPDTEIARMTTHSPPEQPRTVAVRQCLSIQRFGRMPESKQSERLVFSLRWRNAAWQAFCSVSCSALCPASEH